jgi:hypothetical protein
MTRVARFTTATLAALALGACAALPEDAPVVEQLDPDTGATVTRLGHPIELYRETFVKDATGRFAFVGPFETNQMGHRELFLWVAAPLESPPDAAPPAVEVDGKPLALGAPGRAADFAGLQKSPYRIPTPWSSMYYFKVDAATMAAVTGAQDLAVRVAESTKDGIVRTRFAGRVSENPELQEFAARQ